MARQRLEVKAERVGYERKLTAAVTAIPENLDQPGAVLPVNRCANGVEVAGVEPYLTTVRTGSVRRMTSGQSPTSEA